MAEPIHSVEIKTQQLALKAPLGNYTAILISVIAGLGCLACAVIVLMKRAIPENGLDPVLYFAYKSIWALLFFLAGVFLLIYALRLARTASVSPRWTSVHMLLCAFDLIDSSQARLAGNLRSLLPQRKIVGTQMEYVIEQIDREMFEIKQEVCRLHSSFVKTCFPSHEFEFRTSIYEPHMVAGNQFELRCEAFAPTDHQPITVQNSKGFDLWLPGEITAGKFVWPPGIVGSVFLSRGHRYCDDIQDARANPDFVSCADGPNQRHWTASSLMIPIFPSVRGSGTIDFGVLILDSSTKAVWNHIDEAIVQGIAGALAKRGVKDVGTAQESFKEINLMFVKKLVEIYELQYLLYTLIEASTVRFDLLDQKKEVRKHAPSINV